MLVFSRIFIVEYHYNICSFEMRLLLKPFFSSYDTNGY